MADGWVILLLRDDLHEIPPSRGRDLEGGPSGYESDVPRTCSVSQYGPYRPFRRFGDARDVADGSVSTSYTALGCSSGCSQVETRVLWPTSLVRRSRAKSSSPQFTSESACRAKGASGPSRKPRHVLEQPVPV